MSFRPEEIDLPIDPDWIKGSSAMKITSLKTWRERLSLYYDESQLGDDLRSRLIECVTILRNHDTDYARQRDSLVIRASPRQMAFDAWRKWATDWHASVTAYQEQQLDTDQKRRRLDYLQSRGCRNELAIAREVAERALRQGYGRDNGWETGALIIAMAEDELNELKRLREWSADWII